MDECVVPGARFPAGHPYPQAEDIAALLSSFGADENGPVRLIDSTHDAGTSASITSSRGNGSCAFATRRT